MRAPVSLMDSLADATLSPTAFARYIAYRDVLVADGKSAENLSATLTAFIWDLVDGFSVNGVH